MQYNKPKAILTFDLEFWYNAHSIEGSLSKEKIELKEDILDAVNPILDLLDKYNIKATFFVLGSVAEKYPDLIKTIYESGHEIASHGYFHKKLSTLNAEQFEKEIELSKNVLQKITGTTPSGFRIPACSINEDNTWALKLLVKHGFKYDSSIFPVRTPLYGIKNGPINPYRVSVSNILKSDKNSPLIELPIAVYQFGNSKIRIPIGGGFYFRIIPFCLYLRLLKSAAKKMVPITYFHPYDLHNYIPKTTSVSWFKKQLKFYGVKRGLKKMEKLLKEFNFISIKKYLEENPNL